MRSLLLVPAADARKLLQALASDADALILDLEHGVAPARRDQGRASLRDFLRSSV